MDADSLLGGCPAADQPVQMVDNTEANEEETISPPKCAKIEHCPECRTKLNSVRSRYKYF